MKIQVNWKELKLTAEQIKIIKWAIWEEDVVLVPDRIKIEGWFYDWDDLWILFNDDKQVLYRDNWIYKVTISSVAALKKCKLIPIDRGDLKPGDTAFYSDSRDPVFARQDYYCKILSDDDHVIADGTDVLVYDICYSYRRKVVPLDDNE